MSILTFDFNTSLALYLTNVPTLGNFALILFFLCILIEASFSRLAWVRRTFHVIDDNFDEHTRFSGSRFLFLWILRKLSCLFLCPLIGQQRWNLVNMREHLNDSEHLSQSVFGKIQRRSACPCAKVDTHQSRNVVKFCVVQFLRLV